MKNFNQYSQGPATDKTNALSSMCSRIKIRKHRRQLDRLLRQDDRMLSDIGHSRNELLRALRRPVRTGVEAPVSRELMMNAGLAFQPVPVSLRPTQRKR